MVCEHLRELYQLCTSEQIRLSSSELVHFVCKQCDKHDTCPSNLMEYGEEPYAGNAQSEANPDRPLSHRSNSSSQHQ